MPRSMPETLEDLHHLDAGPRVEIAGRLVGQENRRLGHQRPRDGDALLLAAGQLVRVMVHPVLEPDGPARPGAFVRRSDADGLVPAVEHRQFDVLERRGPRQQIEALKHETDLACSGRAPARLVTTATRPAVEQIAAGRRPVQAAEDVHERRLPRSRRADDADEFAGFDIERHAAQAPAPRRRRWCRSWSGPGAR